MSHLPQEKIWYSFYLQKCVFWRVERREVHVYFTYIQMSIPVLLDDNWSQIRREGGPVRRGDVKSWRERQSTQYTTLKNGNLKLVIITDGEGTDQIFLQSARVVALERGRPFDKLLYFWYTISTVSTVVETRNLLTYPSSTDGQKFLTGFLLHSLFI